MGLKLLTCLPTRANLMRMVNFIVSVHESQVQRTAKIVWYLQDDSARSRHSSLELFGVPAHCWGIRDRLSEYSNERSR